MKPWGMYSVDLSREAAKNALLLAPTHATQAHYHHPYRLQLGSRDEVTLRYDI